MKLSILYVEFEYSIVIAHKPDARLSELEVCGALPSGNVLSPGTCLFYRQSSDVYRARDTTITRTTIFCEMFEALVSFVSLFGTFIVDSQLGVQVLECKSGVEGFVGVDASGGGGMIWR